MILSALALLLLLAPSSSSSSSSPHEEQWVGKMSSFLSSYVDFGSQETDPDADDTDRNPNDIELEDNTTPEVPEPLPPPKSVKPVTSLTDTYITAQKRLTLIVVGAQKCGTSAMAAYLSSHPSVTFARTKEVHFFDVDTKWKQGIKAYDNMWSVKGGDGADGDEAEFRKHQVRLRHATSRLRARYELQNTPHTYACITHPPLPPPPPCSWQAEVDARSGARLKRKKPVKQSGRNLIRGDSEDSGRNLIAPMSGAPLRYGIRAEATPYYIASNTACERIQKTLYSPDDDYRMMLMVREPVARLWSEYMMELRRIDDDLANKKTLEQHPNEIFNCFANHLLATLSTPQSPRAKGLLGCMPAVIRTGPRAKKLEKSFNMLFGPMRNKPDETEPKVQRALKCFHAKDAKNEVKLVEALDKIANGGAALNSAEIAKIVKEAGDVTFTTSCFGPRFVESVHSPEKQFFAEIEEWQECAEKHGPAMKTVSDATKIMKGCYPLPTKGIQKAFLYRSMYPTQLQRCINDGIAPEKVFVIDNQRFKNEGQKVMDEIHSWAGLEAFTYSLEGENDVHDKINQQFPQFEKISGWSINGQYDEMPKDVEVELKEFFKPFNELLFKMVKDGAFAGDKEFTFSAMGEQGRMLRGTRDYDEEEYEEHLAWFDDWDEVDEVVFEEEWQEWAAEFYKSEDR